ncbi:MAG: hypothetical protein KIT08_02775 [Anaerolineales bacterium]|nr:MAG: hypothetical protein KIT08_02775 [Anaerolineales bacterium]
MNYLVPLGIFVLQAILYSFIGLRLGQKSFPDHEDQRAWKAFRTWWMGMGINSTINALSVLAFNTGIQYLPLFILFSVTATLAAASALWGLLTYLLYVYTGNNRSRLVGSFYVAFALFVFVSIYVFSPAGVAMDGFQVAMQYNNPPQGAPAFIYAVAFILLLGLPPVIASIGMFLLYRRVNENSAKYRAGLVSLGIFMLFGLSYIVPLMLFPFGLRTGELPWWPITIRMVGIAALALIYFAYFPPVFVKDRLQVKTVLE